MRRSPREFRSVSPLAIGLAAVVVGMTPPSGARADTAGAPAAGAAPAAPATPTAEGPIPVHVKAQAQLDRNSLFGQRLQFAQKPFAPPSAPIVAPDGSETRLDAHPGKVVVAVFWATWCHVCAQEMPQVDAVAATLGDAPIKFLPVSLDAGPAAASKIAAFNKRKGVTSLPTWIDKDRTNAQQIGLRGTPTSFVIGTDGKLVAVIEGRGFWETAEARRFLDTLAEGASAGE